MAYSLYDAAVTPCAQQLGALAGIIDKAAAHCAANKIEESALLQDRLHPDMFCLARQIRQSGDFAVNTGGRLAGVTPPAMPAVDDTSGRGNELLDRERAHNRQIECPKPFRLFRPNPRVANLPRLLGSPPRSAHDGTAAWRDRRCLPV